MDSVADTAQGSATEKAAEAETSARVAAECERKAFEYSNSARESAELSESKSSETALSAELAKDSADTASTKATEASTAADNAKISETNAQTSAQSAQSYSESAKNSEANAKSSENNSLLNAQNSQTSAASAKECEEEAEKYSETSKSYAVGGTGSRDNEDADNAKYYYEQTKQVSQGLNGIIPQGTVTFANLPTSGMEYGHMYNISDEFVSDERFNDGGGVYYGPGNNVIWISGDLWDVTAGSSVTGVKGKIESTYRQGNVELSAEDVGAVAKEDVDSALSATSTNPVQNNVVTQALNGKQSTITGAISTLVSDNLNPNYVPVSNSEGKVVSSDIKTTELNYLSGVSSNIQTQLNNKQNNLGFTPIQQGGGSGQSTNKIYIGWSGTELKAQVDTTDMGALAFKSHLNDYLPKSGGTMSGVIYGNNGGQFAPDGNVWLKQGGYDNWLSNILNGKINTEPEVYEVPTVLDGISFTYYKFGRIVWVQGGGIFTPVKTPYDGGSITIMNLADMPNVPRPIARARFYAHAIAASAFFDCVVTFNFNTDGYIVYECSADNIYAEYYIQGMFVTN